LSLGFAFEVCNCISLAVTYYISQRIYSIDLYATVIMNRLYQISEIDFEALSCNRRGPLEVMILVIVIDRLYFI